MHAPLPFRIRVAIAGAPSGRETAARTARDFLDAGYRDLFDDASRDQLAAAAHTPVAFTLVASPVDPTEVLVARDLAQRSDVRVEVIVSGATPAWPDADSRVAADDLLRACRRPIVLEGGSWEDFRPADPSETGRLARAAAVRALVDRCDVLIAFDSASDEAVKYATSKRRPVVKIDDHGGAAIERGYGLNAVSAPGLELFNTFEVGDDVSRRYVENVYSALFDNPEGRGVPADRRALVRERLLPFYVRASQIAKDNQKLYQRSGLLVYSFAPLAVAAVAIGSLAPGFAPYAYALELVLLLSIFFVVVHCHRQRTHQHWIESRFLAERIRSAVFLAVCGVEAAPMEVPPYMGAALQRDDWMVMVFDEIWSRLPPLTMCDRQTCRPVVDFIRERWIEEQAAFHRNKSARVGQVSHRLEVAGVAVFVLATAAAAIHLGMFVPAFGHAGLAAGLEHVITFAALALPALGAALGGFRAHREYSRLEKRGRNMVLALTDLKERFAAAASPEALEALLQETEELMLRETQDWLLLMRFVILETPG